MNDEKQSTRRLLEQNNYEVALNAAVDRIRACDLGLQAARAGARLEVDSVTVPYFGLEVTASWATGRVTLPDGVLLPIWEQILVFHYLAGAVDDLAADEDEWVAFRELPDAAFYDAAFRRVAKPLVVRFGADPAALRGLVGRWATFLGEQGDASLVFPALPHVRLAFQLWAGDEDFPAEANVLFSRSTGRCLTAEDAAVLADVALRRILQARL